MTEPGIRHRTVRGSLWSFGSLAGVRLSSLATTTVLAHLLSPRQFGLVALALIVTTALDSVRDIGLNEALVVVPDSKLSAQANTAFFYTVLAGVAFASLIAALSPLAAWFFHEHALVALLAVLGLNLPLRSLALTHYAIAQRSIDFRSRTIAEMAEVLVRGVSGIAFALAGLGAWSLVLGYLCGTSAWTGALWLSVRWRPSLRSPRGEVRSLLRFGGGVTILTVIGTATSYVDNIFVGKVLGPAALGIYSLGYRLPDLLISSVNGVAGTVLFPAFAKVGRLTLRQGIADAIRYTLLLGLPLAAGMIVLADPFVLTVFGARWRNAAPVMQVLSVGYLGTPISTVTSSAFKAARRVDVAVWMNVPQLVLLVTAIAIFVDRGIVAVAICQTAVRVLFAPIGIYAAHRILGLRVRALWSAAWPTVLACIGMSAAMIGTQHVFVSSWTQLLAGGTLGAAVYGALAWLLERDSLRGLWRAALRSEPLPSAP